MPVKKLKQVAELLRFVQCNQALRADSVDNIIRAAAGEVDSMLPVMQKH